MGNVFTKFGWSRDDAKWTIGMATGIVVGLATLSDSMVVTLGLPTVIIPLLPWCRLVSIIVGITSAKMASSSLFGGKSPQ